MPIGFVPNPLFVTLLVASGQMEPMLTEIGRKKAEIARSIAPVDTGAFQASIAYSVSPGEVQLSANTPYAMYLEFGTEDTPTFATLRRALETPI